MRIALATLLAALGIGVASPPASAQYGYGVARGSYLRSCTRVEQRGPHLRAMCRTRYGDYIRAGIDTRRCRGPIANSDGRLVC